MGEEHLDLLSELHRDVVLAGFGDSASDLTGIFVLLAGDLAGVGIWATLGFGWARLADFLQCAVAGEPEFAWRAASYIFENYGEYFWRRLPNIVLEDVGIANLKLVRLVLVLSSDGLLRAKCDGCIRVASLLIGHLGESIKDRFSDDLYDVLTRDSAVEDHRLRILDAVTPSECR